MLARLTKNRVYDLVHKSVTTVLIGFTGGCTVWLGYRGYIWVMHTRPEISRQYRLKMEESMAQQQTERESELLQQQKEAETLKS